MHEGLVNSYKNHYLPLQKPSVGRILLESIDASASAGIGIGFKAEIVNVGIGAVAKRVITVQQSKADIWAGTQDKISASASAGPAKTSYTLQDWQHEFSDECICWEWEMKGKHVRLGEKGRHPTHRMERISRIHLILFLSEHIS